MERSVFAARLHAAVGRARDFARGYVTEALPDAIRLRVVLNASYDGNPLHPAERVYPEDSGIEPGRFAACSEAEAVELLLRDGAVPEWINASVVGMTSEATVVELLSCGRFTADEGLLYHREEGRAPFHVLGPGLPNAWVEGQRFSIFHRATCRTGDELHTLRAHAQSVGSLRLEGPVFDDATVATLPPLGALEHLELLWTRLEGAGLAGLDRHPRLRALRVELRPPARFDLGALPALSALEELSLRGLAATPAGIENIAEKLPGLTDLTLATDGALDAPARCPPRLRRLSVTAQRLTTIPRLPAIMDGVGVHLAAPTPGELEALLAPVAHLDALELQGTATPEALVRALVERLHPRYVNVTGTGLTRDDVQRLAASYPGLRTHPRYR